MPTPILGVSGLLRLVEWILARQELVQGSDPCPVKKEPSLPPRLVPRRTIRLEQLWNLLTERQRQQTLVILSAIVARQMDVLLDGQEVRDERS